MEELLGLPILPFENPKVWRQWLDDHHTQETGIWLKIAKKASGIPSITYAEALDEALCYGWIDGMKRTYDEHYFLQKFTPRRPKSMWSKINVEKIAKLTAMGRMHSAGIAAVEAAKQDGRWEQAYDAPSTITTPPDFQAALDAHPDAKVFFESLNKTNTYAFLWRIHTAKKPETRQARIDKFIAMLTRNEKLQ